jgi:hypothetical protein
MNESINVYRYRSATTINTNMKKTSLLLALFACCHLFPAMANGDGRMLDGTMPKSRKKLPIKKVTVSQLQQYSMASLRHAVGIASDYRKYFSDQTVTGNLYVTEMVGIGTTSPAAKLHVSSGSIRLDAGYSLDFGGSNTFILGDAPTNHLRMYTANEERLRIDASGNVGIGTTTPNEKLTLDNADHDPKIQFGNAAVIGVGGNYLGTGSNTDGNMIFRNDNSGGNFLFGFSGGEKMRIANSGNVGVGITNPASKLVVAADANFGADAWPSGQLRIVGATNSNKFLSLGFSTADNFGFVQAGEDASGYRNFIINPSGHGSVGIGTIAPISRLDVSETGLGSVVWPIAVTNPDNNNANNNNPSGTGSGIKFKMSNPGEPSKWAGIAGVSESGWANTVGLAFYTGTTGQQERMRISNAGNVGIGTINPQAKLEIKSGFDTEVLRFGYGTTDYHTVVTSFNGTYPESNYLGFDVEHTSSDIRRVLTLRGNGHVGIGNDNPAATLQVGDGTASKGIYIKGTKSDIIQEGANLNLGESTLQQNGSGGLTAWTYNGGWQSRLFIHGSSGKIGIGTTNPQELLSVNGSILAKKVRVSINSADWPDYVFAPSYRLRPLSEVENYINKYSHLPEVTPAATIEKNGVDLGASQAELLKKVEELTLYAISQEKRTNEQEKTIKQQAEKLKQLEELLNKLLNDKK